MGNNVRVEQNMVFLNTKHRPTAEPPGYWQGERSLSRQKNPYFPRSYSPHDNTLGGKAHDACWSRVPPPNQE